MEYFPGLEKINERKILEGYGLYSPSKSFSEFCNGEEVFDFLNGLNRENFYKKKKNPCFNNGSFFGFEFLFGWNGGDLALTYLREYYPGILTVSSGFFKETLIGPEEIFKGLYPDLRNFFNQKFDNFIGDRKTDPLVKRSREIVERELGFNIF